MFASACTSPGIGSLGRLSSPAWVLCSAAQRVRLVFPRLCPPVLLNYIYLLCHTVLQMQPHLTSWELYSPRYTQKPALFSDGWLWDKTGSRFALGDTSLIIQCGERRLPKIQTANWSADSWQRSTFYEKDNKCGAPLCFICGNRASPE